MANKPLWQTEIDARISRVKGLGIIAGLKLFEYESTLKYSHREPYTYTLRELASLKLPSDTIEQIAQTLLNLFLRNESHIEEHLPDLLTRLGFLANFERVKVQRSLQITGKDYVFQFPDPELAFLLTDQTTMLKWLVYKHQDQNQSWDRQTGDSDLVSKWYVLGPHN